MSNKIIPKIFIGSSVEGVNIAKGIQANLHHTAWAKVWTQAFPLSSMTLDALLQNSKDYDFAIFVFSADDEVKLRGKNYLVARDNVIFEAGLFMGVHGRNRCFIVAPNDDPNLHFPSDFSGFTFATYDTNFAKKDLLAALGTATTLIELAIRSNSLNSYPFFCSTRCSFTADPKITHHLKLYVKLKNTTGSLMIVKNLLFKANRTLNLDSGAQGYRGENEYSPKISLDYPGTEVRYDQVIIEPDKSATLWIPFDSDKITSDFLEKERLIAAIGIISFDVFVMDEMRQVNVELNI